MTKLGGRSPARIVLVDDHPIVRQGYGQLINSQSGLEVCGEAADSAEALRIVRETQPDLMVIDISLKDGSGLELCKQIRAHFPTVKMLVASMHDETLFAERSLRAGATGYINKQEATDQLLQAIEQVLRGQVYLSPQMTERMLHRTIGSHEDLQQSPVDTLSDRELEVFCLIGEGMATRDIAAKLQLSPKTIETYRENIKEKLNVRNSAELTRHAVQWVLENS